MIINVLLFRFRSDHNSDGSTFIVDEWLNQIRDEYHWVDFVANDTETGENFNKINLYLKYLMYIKIYSMVPPLSIHIMLYDSHECTFNLMLKILLMIPVLTCLTFSMIIYFDSILEEHNF